MNATNCCESLNVNPSCIDACSAGAFLDLDSVLDQPECVNDLPKIVKCAAGIFLFKSPHFLSLMLILFI